MTSIAMAPTPARKQILRTLAVFAVIVAIFGIVKYFQISKAIANSKKFAPPPDAVTSVTTAETTWPRTLLAIGSITPTQGVTVSAEEPGKVVRITFESGSTVKQGDLLVELDTSVEDAKLSAAQAKLDWSKRQLARAQKLRASSAVSQEVLDDAISQQQQNQGEVESLRATIAKKKISAPFSGRTGIRLVNVGEYLATGTPVVPLHAMNTVYVDFSIPQQEVSQVAVGQRVEIQVDAFPGRTFVGAVTAVNPQVDSSTRNIQVRATVPNQSEELRAGMFAQVRVILAGEDKLIALPATSVQYAPYGDTVYVIEQMKKPTGEEYLGVRQQVVKLGRRQGEQIAILDGLKPGEQVVTSGVFKLHPGSAVSINNTFSPGNSLEPKPADT